ncbi:MAG TPA: peptide-methionine (S)-S-oxide reductase MsrA [Candidatus Saccharimonadales bacterium]|nr:peptide-methionine (S)-S-oxide reductase MsrA [Candidatus Saccharimonadales bacterium]
MGKETAIFAAGCFWGVQDYFDKVKGVLETEVGYTGGHTKNPTYEDVCTSRTGHAESIRIIFDPDVVSYEELVQHFFYMHDPTQLNRQGPDMGDEYRSAIFYLDETQKTTAKKVIQQLADNHHFRRSIVTTLEGADTFYRAEEFHQNFVKKHGFRGCPVSPPQS